MCRGWLARAGCSVLVAWLPRPVLQFGPVPRAPSTGRSSSCVGCGSEAPCEPPPQPGNCWHPRVRGCRDRVPADGAWGRPWGCPMGTQEGARPRRGMEAARSRGAGRAVVSGRAAGLTVLQGCGAVWGGRVPGMQVPLIHLCRANIGPSRRVNRAQQRHGAPGQHRPHHGVQEAVAQPVPELRPALESVCFAGKESVTDCTLLPPSSSLGANSR